jgi:hypothetical protein
MTLAGFRRGTAMMQLLKPAIEQGHPFLQMQVRFLSFVPVYEMTEKLCAPVYVYAHLCAHVYTSVCVCVCTILRVRCQVWRGGCPSLMGLRVGGRVTISCHIQLSTRKPGMGHTA